MDMIQRSMDTITGVLRRNTNTGMDMDIVTTRNPRDATDMSMGMMTIRNPREATTTDREYFSYLLLFSSIMAPRRTQYMTAFRRENGNKKMNSFIF
mmetsp:Transcript_21986/g.24454  ORF Transcript_21986/g.24454 Transcript_21986/m.24454 type:complete len:96 (+) Transcript_21986:341-628(+)